MYCCYRWMADVLNKCSSYVLSCACIGIEMCWPLLHPLCRFPFHYSQFLVFFGHCPSLFVTVEFPPSWLPPSPSPTSVVSLPPNTSSLCSLSSLLFCMSAGVSPNSNSLGGSVGTSIFFTFFLAF